MSRLSEKPLIAPAALGLMRVASSPVIRIAVVAAGLLFFTYASVRVVLHQRGAERAHALHDPAHVADGDWGVYYRAALAMRLRLPLYTLEHGPLLTFKNPPVVALLIAPLTTLGIAWARWAWLVGDLVCLILVYALACRVVFKPDDPPALRAVLIGGAVVLTLHYVLDELFAGTTSPLYLLMTVAAFVWAQEDKPVRAGAALAMAVCLKLVPLAFLPWLLLCRRPWRSLPSFAAVLALLMLLPAIWVGSGRNLALLRQWPQHLAATEIRVQDYRPTNQSLGAMLTRQLTPAPDLPGLYHVNVVSLSQRTAHGLWLAIACLLGGILYAWILLQRHRRRLDSGAALALLLLFMTLCNPLAWRYTYLALGVPCLYVLHSLAGGLKPHRIVLALLAGAYLLHFAPEFLQALSAQFWGAVALTVAVVIATRCQTVDTIYRHFASIHPTAR